MRGDTIYLAWGRRKVPTRKDEKDLAVCGGARTRHEAEEAIEKRKAHFRNLYERAQEKDKPHWDLKNWDFWIEERTVATDFLPPPKKIRERYTSTGVRTSEEGWVIQDITVYDDGKPLTTFERRLYANPFEPFWQLRDGEWKPYALISPDYTGTSVMDLQTGKIICAEPHESWGFCPVGFYVPDWWDVHDDSIIPGSLYWDKDNEEPVGDFGFVWGCVWADDSSWVWADDSSWKLQYLDLSQISEGKLARDDRFGYVELFTVPDTKPPPFIQYYEGSIRIAVEKTYRVDTGKSLEEE